MIKDNPPPLPKGEKQSIQIDGAMIESIAYSLSDRQVRKIEAAAFERGMAARQYEVDNAFLLVSESDYKWERAEKENDELRAKLKALEEPEIVAGEYGCHIDLNEGQAPDGCVLDDGVSDDCFYARRYGVSARNYCREWKPIKIIAAGAKHE